MHRFKFLIVALFSLLLTGCTLPFAPKKSALQVTSTPKATVFLDGKHVGQTPFLDDKLKPGDYTLKLVPEDPTGNLQFWETKIRLSPQILSVVNREIAATDADSSGETLTLEPLSSKTKTSLSIISIPENAVVKLDSQPKGFSPTSLEDVAAGEHTITLTAPGYKEKNLRAKVTLGNKLTISAQLARSSLLEADPPEDTTPPPAGGPEASSSPSPSPSPKASGEVTQIASASATAKTKPYVEILDNTNGFLRVRSEPATTGTEVARAIPGQHLPYLNEEANGWYKVTYATGKSGWVARGQNGEYAKLVQ